MAEVNKLSLQFVPQHDQLNSSIIITSKNPDPPKNKPIIYDFKMRRSLERKRN